MKLLNIKNSWFSESDLRLDASFHLSEGRIARKIIDELPFEKRNLLELTSKIFYGGRSKRIYVENNKVGIPFIGSSDMLKSDLNSLKFISKKLTKGISNFMLEEGWILISRSGTIGNTTFTNQDFIDKAASEHIIRVIPNEDIKSGYLYAFLTSKYGYSLMTQGTFGAVIQHIEPEYLSNLSIPIFSKEKQEKIHNLIIESSKLRVEATKLMKEAVDYFDKNYKVDGLTKIFSKNVKDIGFSWASYNNNLESDIIEKSFKEYYTIRDVAEKCFAPPMFKHIYLDKDNGHPFLTGAELTKFIKKYYRWLSPRGVKNIQDYKVKKGTLLLYKSGTTDGGILGNVFIADDILDGACLSDHVIRIFTEDIKMSYWMYAFFKSDAGIRLLQKTATGSMIPFITPERLLDIKFPKPNEKFNWIARIIEEYIEKNVKSQLNELEAINLIEKEIESWQKS